MAIEEWAKLQDGQDVPLERALAAFDMFILREGEGDFDDVRWHTNMALEGSNISVGRSHTRPLGSRRPDWHT